jgi:hypothetical protein
MYFCLILLLMTNDISAQGIENCCFIHASSLRFSLLLLTQSTASTLHAYCNHCSGPSPTYVWAVTLSLRSSSCVLPLWSSDLKPAQREALSLWCGPLLKAVLAIAPQIPSGCVLIIHPRRPVADSDEARGCPSISDSFLTTIDLDARPYRVDGRGFG